MRVGHVTTWLVIGAFVAGCGAQTGSPGEQARLACATAGTVPVIGRSGQDSYSFSPGVAAEWVDILRGAADTAAAAAAADHEYDGLAHDLSVVRDDMADVRDALAADSAIVGDDLTAIEGDIAALVEACRRIDASG